jgi:hypothetical protein
MIDGEPSPSGAGLWRVSPRPVGKGGEETTHSSLRLLHSQIAMR